MNTRKAKKGGLLKGARVYLSGPMDFVASRADEKKSGWRTRVGEFLRAYGVTVFDPWNKPTVRGLYQYGIEGEATTDARKNWVYGGGQKGARIRSEVARSFWPALHVDLRMVDTSDFVIAYCPTNIYSVGTPHEIILARQQRKPVLFVSPYVEFQALADLKRHLRKDREGTKKLDKLISDVPIKENENASPSLWYMPLVGGERFFDGFGFSDYKNRFGWTMGTPIDANEKRRKPDNPLLPFLERLDKEIPTKWSPYKKRFVKDDDWLLWDLLPHDKGADVKGPRKP